MQQTVPARELSPRAYAILAAAIIALGVTLHIDALRTGFAVDDYAQLAMMRGVYPVDRAPLALFTFTSGDSHENEALKGAGFLPWWSHPELRIAMFRPLSSALMWLDLRAFGLEPFGYHLHSLLWWVAMLSLLAAVLRKLLPSWIALLALLLFTLDEAHGPLLGWVAMRNAIVASTFALLGLRIALQESPPRSARWLSLACYALALLASEYALGFLGYALLRDVLDVRGSAERLRKMAPWGALLGVYFAARAALGFGAAHSGMYLDPIADSGELLRHGAVRLPVLVGDLVLGLRANWWTSGFPWLWPVAPTTTNAPSWVFDMLPARAVQEWLGVLALAIALPLCISAYRDASLRAARFLVLGAPLALLPFLSAFPESRLLAPALIGFSIVLASFFWRCLCAWRRAPRRPAALLGLSVSGALVLYHLALPAWSSWAEQRIGAQLSVAVQASILAPDLDARLRAAKHTLLLGAADPTTSIYVPLVRRLHGRATPQAYHLLSATFVPQRLTRVSSSAFRLTSLGGGYTPGDAYFSAFNSTTLQAGQRFEVAGGHVVVESTWRGRPMQTRYELDARLDGPEVLLLLQTATGLVQLRFPEIGESIGIPPPVPPIALTRR